MRMSENRTVYRDEDDRHNQTYYGKLQTIFDIEVDRDKLPDWPRARKVEPQWSKYTNMLSAITARANAFLFLMQQGRSASELGEADFQGATEKEDRVFDLADQDCPAVPEPIRPFDELKSLNLSFNYSYGWGVDSEDDPVPFSFSVTFTAHVERPSMIPSEEEFCSCEAIQGKPLTVVPQATVALGRAIEVITEKINQQARVNEATHVAKQLATHFREQGDERSNFKERKRTLIEDREAATREVADEFAEEHSREEIAEKMQCDPRAVDAALENWDEFVSFGIGGFPGSGTTKSQIDPEKVE